MKISGIYKIENTTNGRYYIGSSKDILGDRWPKHKAMLRHNRHHNQHLQRAWNKYGESCFRFLIVETLQDASDTQLLTLEQGYLDGVKTNPSSVYNLNFEATGGGWTDEWKKKHRIATKLALSDPMVRLKISNALKGKSKPPRSAEHCLKISHANKGKSLSPEHRAKIVKTLIGRPVSMETRTKLEKTSSKHWVFLSPSNEIVEFDNLKKFCQNTDLTMANMQAVSKGRRKSHKGWTQHV